MMARTGPKVSSRSTAVDFLKLVPPTRDDLSDMLEPMVVKTRAMVWRRGLLDEEPCDALTSVQAEAVRKALPWAQQGEEDPKKLAAFLEGFSLQAGTLVHERDRDGLENPLRYALRPPLSLERLARGADGRVVLSLRRPLREGTTRSPSLPLQGQTPYHYAEVPYSDSVGVAASVLHQLLHPLVQPAEQLER